MLIIWRKSVEIYFEDGDLDAVLRGGDVTPTLFSDGPPLSLVVGKSSRPDNNLIQLEPHQDKVQSLRIPEKFLRSLVKRDTVEVSFGGFEKFVLVDAKRCRLNYLIVLCELEKSKKLDPRCTAILRTMRHEIAVSAL